MHTKSERLTKWLFLKNETWKNKALFIALFLQIITVRSIAENPCNVMTPRSESDTWGIGVYNIPDNFELNVYSEKTGEIYGRIIRNSHEGTIIKKEGGGIYYLRNSELDYLYHTTMPLLKVDKCFNPEFVRVLWKSGIDEELYVSKIELTENKSEFSTYQALLHDHNRKMESEYSYMDSNIGVNLIKNCLNLRTLPSKSGHKILCIPSNDWESEYVVQLDILEFKDAWARIHYTELHPTEDHECYTTEKNEKVGWVKAFSDDGFPNIWFSATSY